MKKNVQLMKLVLFSLVFLAFSSCVYSHKDGFQRSTPTDRNNVNHSIVFTSRILSEEAGVRSVLYRMDVNGANLQALTDTSSNNSNPAWSPDGKEIAFTSDRDGNNEIYLMDANGNNLVRLTNNPSGDYEPVWSPDGERLAFFSDRDGLIADKGGTIDQLYLMNKDGSNLVRLTNTRDLKEHEISWSVNSTKITISSRLRVQYGYLPFEDLFTIDSVNPDPYLDPLLSFGIPGGGYLSDYSPDGERIVFVLKSTSQICIIDLNDRVKKEIVPGDCITSKDFYSSDPSWSSDGKTICFSMMPKEGGHYDIFNMNSDGSNLTQLTNGLNHANLEPDCK